MECSERDVPIDHIALEGDRGRHRAGMRGRTPPRVEVVLRGEMRGLRRRQKPAGGEVGHARVAGGGLGIVDLADAAFSHLRSNNIKSRAGAEGRRVLEVHDGVRGSGGSGAARTGV